MPTVSGQILVLQEERIRLWTDEGQGLLLTLSHRLRGIEDQLLRWQQAGTRVLVEYDGQANWDSAAVRRIDAVRQDGAAGTRIIPSWFR